MNRRGIVYEDWSTYLNPYLEAMKEKFELRDKIEKILVNEEQEVVVVILENGHKGVAKCADGDVFDPEVGFCVAFSRAVLGSRNQVNKALAKATSIKKKEKKVKLPPFTPVWPFRDFMRKKGYKTNEALAEASGVSAATISRICNGYFIKDKTLRIVCVTLNMDNEQIRLLKKSLERSQRRYDRYKR